MECETILCEEEEMSNEIELKEGIAFIAIICLTLLEAMAIYVGMDGTLFSTVTAIIGGLAGYRVGVVKRKSKEGG